jgi:hypothetical protein
MIQSSFQFTDAAPKAKNTTAPTTDTAMIVCGFKALALVVADGSMDEGRYDGREVGRLVGLEDG